MLKFFGFSKLMIPLLFFYCFKATAQISFTGANYSQDFNSLATTGTANTWTNNSTLPGWFLFRQPAPGTAIPTYSATDGGSNAGNLISFGSASSSERALGGLGSGGAIFGSPAAGAIAGWIAVGFINNSGSDINSATIAFNGEQWRDGGAATPNAQTMVLEYGFGATFQTVSAWTAPGGNFNWASIVNVNTTTGAAVNGNAAGLVTSKGGTLSSLSWTNGATLWIRWVERNDTGNDHGLAIDDFSFSASVTPPGTPIVSITATDASASETTSDPGTFRISRIGSTDDALDVNYTVATGAGQATNGTDYNPTLAGTATIGIGQSFVDIIITPVDDLDSEGNETVTLTLTDAIEYDLGSSSSATVTIADNDVVILFNKIHEIQGNATNQLPNISGSGAHNDRSPIEGQSVTIQGIVTAVYNDLDGFFIQEEDSDADADPTTSEAIFVFTGTGTTPAVSEGDLVTVVGAVDEFFGMTQIDNDLANLSFTVISSNNTLPAAAIIDLPIAPNQDIDDFYERYEAMKIRFQDKMVVSEYFEVSRYGQIVLTENNRPFQYSHADNTPTSAEYTAFQNDLARRTIIVDDENNIQNAPLGFAAPNNVFYYPRPGGLATGTQGTNFFRGGDAVNNLTGVLHWSFAGFSGTDAWRIRPTLASPITFTNENLRPATPAVVGGNIRVSSFNVLNYFTTIDNGGTNGGPAGNTQEPRGADSPDELTKQTQKLVQALKGINADVFGLVELENNSGNAGADGGAIAAIVNALNAEVGAGTYNYINTGNVGTDAIAVGIIYKPAVVTQAGTTGILNSAAFTDPNNIGQQRNRPAVAATFQVTNNSNPDFGAKFTVVINHLKSKGSGGETGLDADQLDGQANWNDTRKKAALAMVAWLNTDPTGGNDPDYLVMGDLNAYKGENPITSLKDNGYNDLIENFGGANAYSYVFDGQLGYLDHALANNALLPQVTGAVDWHINADEIPVFDYNNALDDGAGEQDFEAEPAGNNLFEANAYRTSDHDPVIVGLDLTAPCAITLVTSSTNASCPTCNDGVASVIASVGTAPYTYTWTNNIAAATTNIIASRDNSIFQENTGNSNGAGESFVAGTTAAGFITRALLSFDIAGNIPAGASISNANLQLTLTHTSGISGPKTHSVHKLLQNWGEGTSNAGSNPGRGTTATTNDATWIKNFFPGSDWTSAGGAFSATASAGVIVDQPGIYNWSSATMIADVQTWLNTPSSNFGWMLKSDETGNRQAKRYSSRESLTAADRPVLTVTYGATVVGTTASVSNLAPGSYTVTVTDANGCTATATVSVISCAAAGAGGKPMVTLPTRIQTNTVLSAGTDYILNGKVFVENNATLFIDGGVTVFGVRNEDFNLASALVITKMGKIQANGSPEIPIVFRGCPTTPANGDWGGIVILGTANINQASNQTIEGINTATIPAGVDITYGTQNSTVNDNQNSGVLNYVRIENAGAVVSPNNELNGLTLGGVGRGTFIDFVQTIYGADDAFELLGGTVNLKHCIAFSPDDDCFDTDHGYTGAMQFCVSVLNPTKPSFSADPAGLEADNDGTNSSLTPRSRPVLSNMTLIGFENNATALAKGIQNSATFRRNTDQVTRNSVFMGYPTGVAFDAGGSPGSPASAGNFTDNVVHGFSVTASGAIIPVSNTVFVGDPAFSNERILLVDPFNPTFPDFRPQSEPASPALAGANFTGLTAPNSTGGEFFQPVTYKGAFSPGINWNATWSRFFNFINN